MESFVAIGFPWDIGPGSASAVFKGCLVQLPALARAMLVLREKPVSWIFRSRKKGRFSGP